MNPSSFFQEKLTFTQARREGSQVDPSAERSQTIPLPSYHIPRTQSELQLCDDMAVAEHRDLCMFYRVVNGIRERHNASEGSSDRRRPYTSQERAWPGETNMGGVLLTKEGHVESILSYKQPSAEPSVPSERPHLLCNGMNRRHPGDHDQSSSMEVEGGWSIAGYDEGASHPTIVEEEEMDEGGVFSMDL